MRRAKENRPGQFEIVDDPQFNYLTCNYVASLVCNDLLFAPFGTVEIRSFKISRADFLKYFENDPIKLELFINHRLVHIACFDVDLTLFDTHTHNAAQNQNINLRNSEKLLTTLEAIKKMPQWRTIVITQNQRDMITRQGSSLNLVERLGKEFFEAIYDRVDMDQNFRKRGEAHKPTLHMNKAHCVFLHYKRLKENSSSGIDNQGFLICGNLPITEQVIDVVSAVLIDDSEQNIRQVMQYGVYGIQATYTATEFDNKGRVLKVLTNDEGKYLDHLNEILEKGIGNDPEQDDDVSHSCCFKLFSRSNIPKDNERTTLLKHASSNSF